MVQATKQQPALKDQILAELKGEKQVDAEKFAAYCQRIRMETDKEGKLKYPFMQHKAAKELAGLFRRVKAEGLVFDGKHITLQSTGVTYDYVAYKNKMLVVYPESKIDLGVVKEGDEFAFTKDDGKVTYHHNITDPFNEKRQIIGAYFVVKNNRGEFLTLLNKQEIEKHRKAAKTDSIWSAWFTEMVLKTVAKKGCKYHFDDIFEGMNEMDNESYAPDQVVASEEDAAKVAEAIAKIDAMADIKGLQDYFLSLPPQLVKNGDVFEAYNAKKADLAHDAPKEAPKAKKAAKGAVKTK